MPLPRQAPPADCRREIRGAAPRIAIEAAGKFGCTRYVVSEEDVIGLDGFGVSGRAEALYRAFGITREAIIEKARALFGSRG